MLRKCYLRKITVQNYDFLSRGSGVSGCSVILSLAFFGMAPSTFAKATTHYKAIPPHNRIQQEAGADYKYSKALSLPSSGHQLALLEDDHNVPANHEGESVSPRAPFLFFDSCSTFLLLLLTFSPLLNYSAFFCLAPTGPNLDAH